MSCVLCGASIEYFVSALVRINTVRVFFISQLFDPENSIKGLGFARRLTELGYEVEVITTFPSYPHGKIYPGYKQKLKQVDVIDGVRIVRIPTYVNHGKSSVKRILSYISFGFLAGLYALFSKKKPDVIYAYYPPVIVGILAMVVGFFRRTPYVYDVQDLWPEALIATGNIKKDGAVEKIISALCNVIYRNAEKVVVLSDGYKRVLIEKKVRPEKIVRIFNWCDEDRIKPDPGDVGASLLGDGFFNILYAGNFGSAQSLEYVIEAARLLKEKEEGLSIRFLFLGSGVAENELKERAIEYGLKNVVFLPRVSADQVGDYLSAADVLLVHLADSPVFEITIPQKTQAYLLAGRPILMAVRGEAGNIVAMAKAGVVVDPCHPMKLADAAIEMSKLSVEDLREMARNGADFYKNSMSMNNGISAVDDLLKGVFEKSGCHAQ